MDNKSTVETMEKKQAEKIVSNFYEKVGWEAENGVTEDARRWEDLRKCAREYVSKCRLRVLRHIPEMGDLFLDMASGPIQYPEYLQYSHNFNKRYCVDLSSKAIEKAEKKIGEHGVFINKSFFDIEFEDDMFDCTISLHTIYHIDKSLQETAVRKLVRITKPGKPLIIVYSNPVTVFDRIIAPIKYINKGVTKIIGKSKLPELYFFAYTIEWWNQFHDVADIKILPWRSFTAGIQKILFPNNSIGEKMFKVLFKLEDKYPKFFVKHFRYPMIIMTKKGNN